MTRSYVPQVGGGVNPGGMGLEHQFGDEHQTGCPTSSSSGMMDQPRIDDRRSHKKGAGSAAVQRGERGGLDARNYSIGLGLIPNLSWDDPRRNQFIY